MRKKIISLYEPVVGLLSLLAVALFGIDTFFDLPIEVSKLIDFYDLILCLFFFTDFCITFKNSTNKTKYFFTYGWLDLISSIPVMNFFRVGRFAKVIKVIRLLRMAKSAHVISKHFLKNKRQNTVLLTTLMGAIVICLSSILIIIAEDVPGGKIHTAHDAIWWSFVTATTVGYGDYDPVTSYGRFIASILMITGLGIFGVLTASLSSFFSHFEPEANGQDIQNEINEIKHLLMKLQEQEVLKKEDEAA